MFIIIFMQKTLRDANTLWAAQYVLVNKVVYQ